MSQGRIMKDFDGPSEVSPAEAKSIYARLRSGQIEKFQKARRVRYVEPDKIVFIYADDKTETGVLHREPRR